MQTIKLNMCCVLGTTDEFRKFDEVRIDNKNEHKLYQDLILRVNQMFGNMRCKQPVIYVSFIDRGELATEIKDVLVNSPPLLTGL